MAKDYEKDNDEIYQLEKKVRDLKKKKVSKCNHRKPNGKLALRLLVDGRFECKRCGEVFSMDQIKKRDIDNALMVVHDMINQTRCLTNPDKQRDVRISEDLGVLNFDLKESAELYERIVRKAGNNRDQDRDRDRNRNRDDRDGFGLYSPLSLSGNRGGGKKDGGGKKKGYYY